MLINSHKQIIPGTFPYILGTSKLFHIFFPFLVRISQYSCVTCVHWVNHCINSVPSKITRPPFVFLHYRNFQLYPLLIYDIACVFCLKIETAADEDESEGSDSESSDTLDLSKITEMRLIPSDPSQCILPSSLLRPAAYC